MVRVEVKVSLTPLQTGECATSCSQFSSVMSLTPSGGFAIIGTGYLLISASEMSPATTILLLDKAALNWARLFALWNQLKPSPSWLVSG